MRWERRRRCEAGEVSGREEEVRVGRRAVPRRVAMLSVHTSPLEQPGTGDAGGLNVYVVETARRLAARGTEVEIFTRATSSDAAPVVELAPGVLVRHVVGRPVRGPVEERPARPALCRSPPGCCGSRPATSPAGTTWCTPTTGCPARSAGWPPTAGTCRWCTPCTPWPRSRTPRWPSGDAAEPAVRVIGEEQVVAAADRLLANTDDEARRARRALRRRPEPGGRRPARGRPRRRSPPAGRAAGARPGDGSGLPRERSTAALRRPDPAAQGPRRAAAGGRATWCAAQPGPP